jgi:hypothetical protein
MNSELRRMICAEPYFIIGDFGMWLYYIKIAFPIFKGKAVYD